MSGSMHLQVALPFLHEHELPEVVRFEMQQEEEAQKASGAHSWSHIATTLPSSGMGPWQALGQKWLSHPMQNNTPAAAGAS